MSTSRFWIAAAGVALAAPAPAADLAKIERAIAKEPAYQTKSPGYCLLVFGPEAKTRMWLVRDGDALYADRNGNGDLTERGERLAGAREQGAIRWHVGDVVEAGGKARHADLRVRFRRGSYVLSLRTADGTQQVVGNELARCGSRAGRRTPRSSTWRGR